MTRQDVPFINTLLDDAFFCQIQPQAHECT